MASKSFHEVVGFATAHLNEPAEDVAPAVAAVANLMVRLKKQGTPDAQAMLKSMQDSIHGVMLHDPRTSKLVGDAIKGLPKNKATLFVETVAPILPDYQGQALRQQVLGLK